MHVTVPEAMNETCIKDLLTMESNVVFLFEFGDIRRHLASFVEDDRELVRFTIALPAQRFFRVLRFVKEIEQAWEALRDHEVDLAVEQHEQEQLDQLLDCQWNAYEGAVWGDSD